MDQPISPVSPASKVEKLHHPTHVEFESSGGNTIITNLTIFPQQKSSFNRLSSLYRFNNAPEVVPANDGDYAELGSTSEKPPASVQQALERFRRSGSRQKYNDNRPPRIIFGMSIRTFLIVAAIMMLIVIGAVVGGTVGGMGMRRSEKIATSGSSPTGPSSSTATATQTSTSTSTSASSTSTSTSSSSSSPTFAPSSNCPASNGTTYTSEYATGIAGSVPSSAGLYFTRYCDLSSPLSLSNSPYIAEAYVYSFDDCIEVCAGYNFINKGWNCTTAVYQPGHARPGNCWVGFAWSVKVGSLAEEVGTQVGLLDGAVRT